MFNLNNIGKLIADPNEIRKDDTEGLKELSAKYPYTSIFSLMYLIALKRYGDIHFEDELKHHSYRISDRYNLYYLVEGSAEKITPVEPASEEAVETIPEHIEEIAAEIETQIEPEEVLTNILEEADTSDRTPFVEAISTEEAPTEEFPTETTSNEVREEEQSDETEAEEETSIRDSEEPYFDYEFSIDELDGLEFIRVDKEVLIEEEDPDSNISSPVENQEVLDDDTDNETIADEDDDEDLQKLEENIQLHLISSGYHLEPLTAEEEEKIAEREVQTEENKTAEEDKTEELIEEAVNEQKQESPISFTDWLHADKNFVAPQEKDPTESVKSVANFEEFNPLEELSGEKDRPKTEFFSPSKKAKESLDESQLPVSETLAKIFVLQGNYPKAIYVYEQLMLKFPEKKVFFADSIAQIKEKLNTIE